MQAAKLAFRLALRGLSRSRAMTLVAVFTLGSGMTAAVTLLGVVDSGLRPLPVPDGGDVVAFTVRDARARLVQPDIPVADWAMIQGVFDVGAIRQTAATLHVEGFAARRARGAAMNTAVLRLLRVPPEIGRLPSADDHATVVVGAALYEQFGSDPSLLGARLDVDGVPHTVVGVMPEGFGFPENEAFWTVLPAGATGEVVARLAPGTSRAAVASAVAARLNAVAEAHGLPDAPYRVEAKRWTRSRDGGRDETVVFAGLSAMVIILLLVCCTNVATLLLVRATERSTMLAVQCALGATRQRVTLQLFIESALMAIAGGVLGVGGGFLLLRWMELKLASHWGYYWMTMEVRPPVLLGAFGLVVLAALLAGTMPAIRASRPNLAGLLASSSRGDTDPRQRRLGRWVVGGQVALSSLGIIAAIFLAAEFGSIGRTTARLPLDSVAIARVTLPDNAYADDASRTDLVDRLRSELTRIPGVSAVSVSDVVPGGPARMARLHLPADDDAPPRRVLWVAADAGMHPLYRMRLVAGAALPDDGRARVVLVTDGIADRYFAGRAVGQRIRLEGVHGDGEWAEIVGVVEDWFPDQRAVASERVIVPFAQAASASFFVSLATAGDPDVVVGGVRDAVRRVDGRLPVEELQTLRARMDWFLRMTRVIAGFGVFGGLGSALVAAVGLYGVMAFQVRTRRREIGIRMAMGAAAPRIVAEVLRESLARVAPGLIAGIGFALVSVPSLAGVIGVPIAATGMDRLLVVCLASAGILLLVGLAAGAEPAVRASRLDPQEVLRAD